MLRILITEEAFAAIGGGDAKAQESEAGVERYGAAPAGSVAIWLHKPVVDALKGMRNQGESLSDTIVRYAKEHA
jgi:hypothetical protein